MPALSSNGPYRTLDLGDGTTAPWYMLPFDKRGRCTAPQARAALLAEVKSGDYSDVIVFSHGWNNDWATASGRYEHFIDGYAKMRRDRELPTPDGFRPLLVGIFWPSTALILPWERAPRIAATARAQQDAETDQENRAIEELAALVEEPDLEEFYTLTRNPRPLTEAEARRLAEIMLPLYRDATHADRDFDPPDPSSDDLEPQEIVEVWRAAARAESGGTDVDDDGYSLDPDHDDPVDPASAPMAAGFPGFLDPRQIVRLMTVYQMKDRAGVVGTRGVGPLLDEVLELQRTNGRSHLHLIGHSYGGKVMLSAISATRSEKPVTSLLLVQPAVNGWCFAADVAGRGYPGGYRPVLARVSHPILTTYSRYDVPLTRFFHLAVRRRSDLGELRIAGAGQPTPPSKYAALGGFGPSGLSDDECSFIPIPAAGADFPFSVTKEVYALDSREAISGHGDISVPASWWALYSLLTHNR